MVEALILNPRRRLSIEAITNQLPELATAAPARPGPHADAGNDPLRQISPVDYVQRLTGRTVSRTGWVACLFHQDTRPSLRVYETPEQGWCCYSAECSATDGRPRGGSIYDLAAPLLGYDLRGPEFPQLKSILVKMFELQAT